MALQVGHKFTRSLPMRGILADGVAGHSSLEVRSLLALERVTSRMGGKNDENMRDVATTKTTSSSSATICQYKSIRPLEEPRVWKVNVMLMSQGFELCD